MIKPLTHLSLLLLMSIPAFVTINSPIAFVTQAPIPQDFCSINATFCNHQAPIDSSDRGGDLWIVMNSIEKCTFAMFI